MRKRLLSIGAGILAMSLVSFASAEMDAGQKKFLTDAGRQLDQAEKSFKVASDGVTGALTQSKARLAMSRLDSVKSSIAQAAARIEKLPVDDPAVGAAQARLDAIKKSVQELETRLTTPQPVNPAPENRAAAGNPGAAEAPPAPAGGAKLDYRQIESLKNADFHTSTVSNIAESLAKLAKEIQTAENPNGIKFTLMSQAVGSIEEGRRKAKNAADHLGALPADGPGVPAVASALKSANASLDASEKVIGPAHQKLAALLDPKNLPSLAGDTKRLQELGSMFGNADVLRHEYTQAAQIVSQIPEANKEHDRIVQQYALLMAQGTDAGVYLAGISKNFKEKMGEFTAAVDGQRKSLPGDIDEDIAAAGKLADEAVAEKKPAFFSGGIADRMRFAEGKLVLLTAVDPESAKLQAAKLNQLRATMKQRQGSLKEGIITANELPNDQYTLGDRRSLESLATEAWKKLQPDAQVLAIRIPSQDWKRETMWRYQNAWYLVDQSKLQVQLLVKQDDRLAVIRPIDLWKDHLSNDAISAAPMDAIKDDLGPQRFLLSEKIK